MVTQQKERHIPLLLLILLSSALITLPISAELTTRKVQATANPIIADGNVYSADPAPLVANGRLYILAGRDEAAPDVNDFVMKAWQMLATDDVVTGKWTHYPALLYPEQVFAWAAPGRAYASQIVSGADGRYYLYAPVVERNSTNTDQFAIGVAVSDHPLGPWRDAHPQGPIISQSLPTNNTLHNIDPTLLVDDDNRVYLYWGSFNQLRGIELQRDMVTPKGDAVTVNTLDGFFEAPWLFKRNGTYYLAYAGNQTGPTSDCTPTRYHACIAYGTAQSPLGPWTYRGVVLDPVSSTTSHPGIIEFKGQWYLVYHTADAKGGGHFRRSVAIDKLEWDDSATPARMRKVIPTRRPLPKTPPQRNIAPMAQVSASNESDIPRQYWIAALNDGVIKANPLPPEMWGSGTLNNPSSQWIQYRWDHPVTLNGVRIVFWADHLPGSSIGVAPPKSWYLAYRQGDRWISINTKNGDHNRPQQIESVQFAPVTTHCLRAVLEASGEGERHAALAVQEWEALAPTPQYVPPTTTFAPTQENDCD
ncbi:glycosyl hydrolase family 43 [Pectobacterium araliae]|uniref:family 43 glycosylhydrolase n=1 Tax=Pectobacterium araliae TaxID=3073862 RepID=UPI0020869835|nr:glycosyl hydrolase family 43 [Pectobacterium carotovorum subsp. carotovorum]